jgi:phosphoglycolate phosphatase
MTLMQPSLIIFDLDGTLIDSAPDLNACANRILKKIGCQPITLNKSKTFIGDGIRHFVEKMLSYAGHSTNTADLDRIEKLFLSDYLQHLADLSKPYPNVANTLIKLKQHGYQLGICTNKPQIPSENILKTLDLDYFFEKVAGGDYYPLRKPNRFHLLKLIEDLGETPTRTIMIGDNEHDAKMAKAAGVYFIFCSYGYSRLPINEIDYDERIDAFSEVLELSVLNLNKQNNNTL